MKAVPRFWRTKLRPALRRLKKSWLLPQVVELNFPYTLEAHSLLDRVSLREKEKRSGRSSVVDALNLQIVHEHLFENRFVWDVSNAEFSGKNAHVFIDSHPIQEAIGREKVSQPTVLSKTWRTPTLDSVPHVATGIGAGNYYHWLLEDLPVVLRARKSLDSVVVLIPRDVPSFVLASLNSAGLDYRQVAGRVRVPHLVVPTRGEDAGWHRRSDIKLVRDSFSPLFSKVTTSRKIFVSRRFSNRSFDNEKELEDFLASQGFEIIYLERLPFPAQVELFSGANLVVGTHGAGLANIVFGNPGLRVIEIAPRSNTNFCFETLAATCGVDYERLITQTGGGLDSGFMSATAFEQLAKAIAAP